MAIALLFWFMLTGLISNHYYFWLQQAAVFSKKKLWRTHFRPPAQQQTEEVSGEYSGAFSS